MYANLKAVYGYVIKFASAKHLIKKKLLQSF